MSLRVLPRMDNVPVKDRDSHVARMVRSATDRMRIMDSASKNVPLAGSAPKPRLPPNPMDVPVHAQ